MHTTCLLHSIRPGKTFILSIIILLYVTYSVTSDTRKLVRSWWQVVWIRSRVSLSMSWAASPLSDAAVIPAAWPHLRQVLARLFPAVGEGIRCNPHHVPKMWGLVTGGPQEEAGSVKTDLTSVWNADGLTGSQWRSWLELNYNLFGAVFSPPVAVSWPPLWQT